MDRIKMQTKKPMKDIDSAVRSRLIKVALGVYPPVLIVMLVLGAKMLGSLKNQTRLQ